MVTVLCMGVEPETLARLQRQRRPPILREADSAAHLIAALEHDPTATEAVVIGKAVDDPLMLVHHTHALDQDLAVLLLASSEALEPLREALGFVPSLRGDVNCAPAEDTETLSAAIEEAAKRTQKRRIFRAMSSVSVPRPEGAELEAPLPAPFLVRLLDHSPAGILVLNSQGRIQFGNPSAIDLLGLAEKELVGRSFVLLFPEPEWERLSHHLARCSATERRIPGEVFHLSRPSGAEHALVVSASPLPGARGERGTLVFLDEQPHLERGVERPLDARAEARRLESLACFAGDVGAQLGGRLGPIMAAAEQLLAAETKAGTAQASALLERIREEGAAALEIVDQALIFAGHKPLRAEDIELSALVQEALASVDAVVPMRIALSSETPQGLPAIVADAALLRSTLRHLLAQAAAAIGPHAGRIAVSTGVAEPREAQRLTGLGESHLTGPCVYLQVADDAREREPASRLRAFDRRAGTSVLGTDLALAAVLGAVRSHGGSVEVEFPPCGGTAFRVLFPAQGAGALRPAEEAAPLRGTVLVVHGEESVCSAACRLLEWARFEVLVARDGNAALEILSARGKELLFLLLDARLGTLPLELLAALDSKFAGLPVVLTGEAGRDPGPGVAHLLGRPPAAVLAHPLTSEALLGTVRQVLLRGV